MDTQLDPRRLAELDGLLDRLATALGRLGDGMIAIREAVATDSPGQILGATSQVEEASAQVARLEAERQRLQDELEQELGVHGLPEVVTRVTGLGLLDPMLEQRLDDVRQQVTRLQDEETRTAALLTTAIQLAIRMRAYLGRLGGTDGPYRPDGSRGTVASAGPLSPAGIAP